MFSFPRRRNMAAHFHHGSSAVSTWLLAMSSCWWCDSKLRLQTCVWLIVVSFKYVSIIDECALKAKVSLAQVFSYNLRKFCANSEQKTGSVRSLSFYLSFPLIYLLVWKAALFSGKNWQPEIFHFKSKQSILMSWEKAALDKCDVTSGQFNNRHWSGKVYISSKNIFQC